MVLVDPNVLLHAVNTDAPRHDAARAWLENALAGKEPIGFAWVVLLAFLRLGTRSAVLPAPMSVREAFDHIESWLAQRPATTVEPTRPHATVLRGLVEQVGTAGNLTS